MRLIEYLQLVLFLIAMLAFPSIVGATACSNNWAGGECSGSITYTVNTVLTNNVNATANILINSGVVLSTSGYSVWVGGDWNALGATVFTGNGLLFIYFAMATAIIIGAFLVAATPIFFVAGIFFVAIDILIAAIMHNVFFTVLQTSFLAPYLNQYPFLVLLVEGYPVITFVIAIVVLIFTFSPKGGNY